MNSLTVIPEPPRGTTILSGEVDTHRTGPFAWYMTNGRVPAFLTTSGDLWGFQYLGMVTRPEYFDKNNMKFTGVSQRAALDKAMRAGRTVYWSPTMRDFLTHAAQLVQEDLKP